VSAAVRSALELIRNGQQAQGIERLRQAVNAAVGAGELDAADAALVAALALVPRAAALIAQRAGIAALRGERARCVELAREALALDVGETMAATLLVDALVDAAQPSAAVAVADACLARQPQAAHVQRARASALSMLGRAPEAVQAGEVALRQLGPNPSATATALMAALYDDTLAPQRLAAMHRSLAAAMPPDPLRAPPPPARAQGARIRVGVLSPDLRQHPMGWFAEPLLRHLDRDRFELHVYARVMQADAHTERLRAIAALAWRDVAALSDAATHAAIRADRIDVLLDLAGYTHGGRPRLLAARTAACQLSWLGYPYPTGLAAVDGSIVDADCVPEALAALHPGRLLRIEGSMFCLPPATDAPPVAPLPAAGGSPFTFGSFNHLAKLSDATVGLWCEVLAAVPDSRLVLGAVPLGEPATRAAVSARFAARGIDPSRLELVGAVQPLARFLAGYARIDVALDPLPFNGATTTLQALWQGVPTLTLPGASLQNRMGLSILRAAGLAGECVARDRAHYVALARGFAHDRARLAALRAGLRTRLEGSGLTDAADFARRFGALLARAAG
jgi:predicted O-linked N-acetylglucosamine transferase (SPINDLY family)